MPTVTNIKPEADPWLDAVIGERKRKTVAKKVMLYRFVPFDKLDPNRSILMPGYMPAKLVTAWREDGRFFEPQEYELFMQVACAASFWDNGKRLETKRRTAGSVFSKLLVDAPRKSARLIEEVCTI